MGSTKGGGTRSTSQPNGFEGRGGDEYQQCSADTGNGQGGPHKGGGDAVKASDKSVAPREFNKSEGKGADAITAGDKGVYPRSFPKKGYDGSQPCENQLNKEETQMKR